MTNFFALVAFLAATLAYSAEIPLSPELDARLNGFNPNSVKNTPKQAIITYDASVLGGASTAAIPLGVLLPQNSVVMNGAIYIDTPFVDNGSATYLFKCGSTSLMTAIDLAAQGDDAVVAIKGSSTGSAGFTNLTSECTVTMTTASTSDHNATAFAATAGRAELILNYFVHQ